MSGQAKHGLGYGFSEAFGGVGRQQDGKGNWGGGVAKANRKSDLARDGAMKGGYQKDAHGSEHHGSDGEAVGGRSDFKPMRYDSKLHSEGMEGIGYSTRAEHHSKPGGEAHRFERAPAHADGFGHSSSNRKGPLRMSGHSRAHRLGCK
jgi:hypothetical protein